MWRRFKRVGTWSRGGPAGVICSLRPFRARGILRLYGEFPLVPPNDPMCGRCLVVRRTCVQLPSTLL